MKKQYIMDDLIVSAGAIAVVQTSLPAQAVYIAKELLKNTKNSVTDICFLCGYSNLTNFLKSFKKHTNQSPSEYRSNHA